MTLDATRALAALLGVLYGGLGLAEIALALVPVALPAPWAFALPPDLLDGYVLAVIGALLLTGARAFGSDREAGIAYAYVAAVFAVAFGLLALLVLAAGAADLLIAGGGEPGALAGGVGPALYLAPAALLLYLGAKREFGRQE